MGTEFRVVLFARDEARARAVMTEALGRIRELDGVLSDYDPTSELRRLTGPQSEAGAVRVSSDLMAMLLVARAVHAQTDGAFDLTVGPLVRLWRRAFRQGELPAPDSIDRALEQVGMDLLVLLPEDSQVWPTRAGMGLDPGGIGKGFALDRALAVITEAGIDSALVEGGGDLVVSGPPPGQEGWRIALDWGPDASPDRHLVLAHGAVATSGDLYQALRLEGQAYSHILDPRTGWALLGGRRASVVAPTGAQADALASALCVAGPAGIDQFIEGLQGVEAMLLEMDPSNAETVSCGSEGWVTMMGARRHDRHR
ncbi:MAG: FAD:protein FMN transferase [bacterium]